MRSSCAANPEGDSDAHSGLGDFGDRDGLNRAGGGPDVRSGLPGLSASVRTGGVQLLRMQLHVAVSVQRVGIGPRGTVRHQSIFRGRGRAPGTTLSAASSRLLNMILRRLVRCHRVGVKQTWARNPAMSAGVKRTFGPTPMSSECCYRAHAVQQWRRHVAAFPRGHDARKKCESPRTRDD
jgi:hypothetical protein